MVLCTFPFCRLYLAAIHNNSNCGRGIVLKDGEPVYRVRYPKQKKGAARVTTVKSPTDYSE